MVRPTNNPGLQRRIRDAIYQLKLDWGVPCDLYNLVSSGTNYDTGTKTDVITKHQVRRAVKMPASLARSTYISPFFTQTNKPFITKGSGWDEVTDLFFFDGRDIRGISPTLQYWIVHNHIRYEIKEIEELGERAGWVIGTTLAKGSPTLELHYETINHDVGLTNQSGATL